MIYLRPQQNFVMRRILRLIMQLNIWKAEKKL